MLLYYSQTVSAIATATCDLRAAALLLFEAITTEATPTLIQGGTPSPPEGSLVLPHAHKRRPSKNKEPSVSMKVVMTATLRRGAVS